MVRQKKIQGLQIFLMSGVSLTIVSRGDYGLTSASQILESFSSIRLSSTWSQHDLYTLSSGIHEVAVSVRSPGKLKSMMAVIE